MLSGNNQPYDTDKFQGELNSSISLRKPHEYASINLK